MKPSEPTLNEPLPAFLSPSAAAKYLGISPKTIYRYLHQKKDPLPVIYLTDQSIRIPWEEFELWIQRRKKVGDK